MQNPIRKKGRTEAVPSTHLHAAQEWFCIPGAKPSPDYRLRIRCPPPGALQCIVIIYKTLTKMSNPVSVDCAIVQEMFSGQRKSRSLFSGTTPSRTEKEKRNEKNISCTHDSLDDSVGYTIDRTVWPFSSRRRPFLGIDRSRFGHRADGNVVPAAASTTGGIRSGSTSGLRAACVHNAPERASRHVPMGALCT